MGANNWTEDQLKAIEKRDSNIKYKVILKL